MKDFYIRDAAQFENKVITTSFVVAAKQVKPKKTGEPYLALTLADRTGHIDAKVWDNVVEIMDTFEQDDFVKVKRADQQVQRAHATHRAQAEAAAGVGESIIPTTCPRPPRTWTSCGAPSASSSPASRTCT